MKLILRLVIFLLMLFVLPVAAQEETGRTKPPAPEFMFTTIPVRCILRDVNIGYGRRMDWYRTWEVRAGYVHENIVLDKYYTRYFRNTEMKYQGPSLYLQYNKWAYGKFNRRWYKGIIAGYRYLFYRNGTVPVGGEGDSYSEELTLSQWRNDVLVLGTIGIATSRYTTTEISLGARVSLTHSTVIDTRDHPYSAGGSDYEAYKANVLNELPASEGISAMVIFRVTTHVGLFE